MFESCTRLWALFYAFRAGEIDATEFRHPQLAAIGRMIEQAASRGADLTRQLLAFARRQPLQPRDTDINNLIVETARLLRPTLGEQVEIDSTLVPSPPAGSPPHQASGTSCPTIWRTMSAVPSATSGEWETMTMPTLLIWGFPACGRLRP